MRVFQQPANHCMQPTPQTVIKFAYANLPPAWRAAQLNRWAATSFVQGRGIIRRIAILIATVALHAVPAFGQAPQPPTIAVLGTCPLARGGAIPDCQLAYRAFGKLNETRTNVVLVPTWLLGRSEDWIPLLGPRGYVDTTRFYVLVVDALANGLSSSPSTVAPQFRDAFRGLSIGDMVESQHRLLVEHLGIKHLHAVVGVSMGGMQAFEWAVRYPAFVDLVVPIVGSPRVGAFDHLLWTTMLEEIESAKRAGTAPDLVWAQLSRLLALFERTPVAVNESSWDSVLSEAAAQGSALREGWSLEDYAAQLGAVRSHDISAGFGSDLSSAARAVRARMLIIYSPDDHMVTAGAAVRFAPLVQAKTLSLPSSCGHSTIICEYERIGTAIREFLLP
jgi:homoserine O-acetyltransferase